MPALSQPSQSSSSWLREGPGSALEPGPAALQRSGEQKVGVRSADIRTLSFRLSTGCCSPGKWHESGKMWHWHPWGAACGCSCLWSASQGAARLRLAIEKIPRDGLCLTTRALLLPGRLIFRDCHTLPQLLPLPLLPPPYPQSPPQYPGDSQTTFEGTPEDQ